MNSGGVLILALAIGLPVAVAQPGPVIRSTTRLVEVHVTVHDSQDRPVTRLRKEDFRIFDERKEQVVTSFTEESAISSARAAPAAVDPETAETAPGNGYSAILLDWLNGGIADRLRGDDAARKVLKTFPPRQSVAVDVLGMEPPNSPHPLRVISDFTEEVNAIAELIEDPGVLPSPEIGEAPGRFDARYGGGGRAASVAEQLYDWRNRILDTVRALTDLADRMARLPGKKSLIWLSNGFPAVINGSVIPGARVAEDLYL